MSAQLRVSTLVATLAASVGGCALSDSSAPPTPGSPPPPPPPPGSNYTAQLIQSPEDLALEVLSPQPIDDYLLTNASTEMRAYFVEESQVGDKYRDVFFLGALDVLETMAGNGGELELITYAGDGSTLGKSVHKLAFEAGTASGRFSVQSFALGTGPNGYTGVMNIAFNNLAIDPVAAVRIAPDVDEPTTFERFPVTLVSQSGTNYAVHWSPASLGACATSSTCVLEVSETGLLGSPVVSTVAVAVVDQRQ